MGNPPVVIGSFDNVPAPGSPIKSDWPQEISNYVQALPRGRIAHAFGTVAQSGITAQTDITGCTVTFTAVNGRYYLTTLVIPYILQSTAQGLVVATMSSGAGTIRQANLLLGVGGYGSLVVQAIENTLGGSTTRKAQLSSSAGSCAIAANTWDRPQIIVEDLGTTLPT